ncbi:hypothetical protein ABZW03_07670, partial [Kitasatospora sp. NPDC004799]|uniref:hypothetical protein n=1 Tax=Kitasatospora sp. NPDC004799 TaxID=3154460 RepID=UPI0033ABA7F2
MRQQFAGCVQDRARMEGPPDGQARNPHRHFPGTARRGHRQRSPQGARSRPGRLHNLLALEPGYVRRSARLLGALDSLSGT